MAESDTPSAAYEALVQFLYQAPIGLVQTTLDGDIIMINPMSAQLLMPVAPDGNLTNLFDVLATTAPQLRELAARAVAPGSVICESLLVPLPTATQGGAGPRTLSIRLLRLDGATLMGAVSDATASVEQEKQRLAERLYDVTRIDNLTLMPNRVAVVEWIDTALATARQDPDHHFSVFFINADRFERVNILLGQTVGDSVLRSMAARIDAEARLGSGPCDGREPALTTGRLGGDEFVVAFKAALEAEEGLQLAQRLVDALCKPYVIGELTVHLTASVGAVTRADSARDAESLLQEASLAMREAKRAGGARCSVFTPRMLERAWQRGSLESELRMALANGQLFVVYQPVLHLKDGAVAGVEALVRWQHPLRGIVSPIEFIEIAEESGLIGPLGEWVLNEACRQWVRWQAELGEQAPRLLAVNLSRAQIMEPTVVQMVGNALQASGLPPVCLQLEVTESLAAQDEVIQIRLHELKRLGLTLALDDFGTGYSSLATLHQLPVDVVKIDRSFVSLAESSPHHRVLIEAVVKVARSLRMETVAEGVETETQADIVADLQCDKVQGYFYARPLAGDAATRWLLAHVPSPRP